MVNKSFKQPPPASSAKASETQKNFVLILLKLFLREIYCLIGIQQTFTNKELSTRVQLETSRGSYIIYIIMERRRLITAIFANLSWTDFFSESIIDRIKKNDK